MSVQDIRWEQRLNNFEKALGQLSEAVEILKQRTLTSLEKQGMIQAFEFTHELGWNLLKDYIEAIGGQKLIGSKDTTREAFQKGLVLDGEVWMQMISSRNLSSHTYNEQTANLIQDKIIQHYYPAFTQLQAKMKSLKK